MGILVIVIVVLGAMLVIASGLWVAVALARAISGRDIGGDDEQTAEETGDDKPPV
ncbi:MAG: hypothetical protein JSU94_12270 [Phycisphaerales bacterium]|nr:MAG: hypothetical protein JSU94_12270 [Phycisphaerales bacterium]